MPLTKPQLEKLPHEDVIALYLALRQEYDLLYEQYSISKTIPEEIPQKFNPKWDWMQKIVFALNKLNKPAQSSEIIGELDAVDRKFDYFKNRGKTFSNFLNRALKYKIIQKIKVRGFRGAHYCLPIWYNEDGTLKLEYRIAKSVF